MSSTRPATRDDLPPIDERLVVPETSFEMDDGELVRMSPADPPHAIRQSLLAAQLHAHVRGEFHVAVELLTRTTPTSDQAPDASVFPRAPDPITGRRQLEHLAFEVVSTQRWRDVSTKARRLAARGVRRVFAIDVNTPAAYEWSIARDDWAALDPTATLVDSVFAVPLPVEPLISALNADGAVAAALRAKRHPEFLAERAEGEAAGRAAGRAEGRRELAAALVLAVLAARGLEVSAADRQRILAEPDAARLERWLLRALTCPDVSALFGVD